jgi:hypothetical protein
MSELYNSFVFYKKLTKEKIPTFLILHLFESNGWTVIQTEYFLFIYLSSNIFMNQRGPESTFGDNMKIIIKIQGKIIF